MKTLRMTAIAINLLLVLCLGCSTGKPLIGGPVPHANLKDGTYDGKAENGPVRVKARVVINDRKIAGIDLIEHRTWKGGAAEGIIPNRIIEKQSTKVDAVSGATLSSVAIMNAVADAVKKAQ
jgi:uncharacterized protein with FMN-binding domain